MEPGVTQAGLQPCRVWAGFWGPMDACGITLATLTQHCCQAVSAEAVPCAGHMLCCPPYVGPGFCRDACYSISAVALCWCQPLMGVLSTLPVTRQF